jgi:ribosomal protein L39E
MRLNKIKQIFAFKRRKLNRAIPLWVHNKTDKKVKSKKIHYSWRTQKLKV